MQINIRSKHLIFHLLGRICIVMDVEGEFPESFKVQTEFGREFEVVVEYCWNHKNLCQVLSSRPC